MANYLTTSGCSGQLGVKATQFKQRYVNLLDRLVQPLTIHGKAEAKDPESGCLICHDDYKNEDLLLRHDGCKASAHAEGMVAWLQEHVDCPNCRASLLRPAGQPAVVARWPR